MDGASFTGQFKNNHINGIGRYVWPDGRRYCGEWVKDKMHGRGVFCWSDGRMYIGDYVDDKKTGGGVFEWYFKIYNDRPEGRKYVGYWQDGKQNGKGIFMSGDGQRKQGEWKNGQRERWTIFEECQSLDKIEKKMANIKHFYMNQNDE